ncbi:MAG: hypothetical protein HY862_16705 [Chloroflexi bacterium]|nr:hypothetical protein [Chloroflexota bacterium]
MRHLLISLLCITVLVSALSLNSPVHQTQAQTDPFGAQWFSDGIMYQVFVRSFYDSNGDGIGDLQGVLQKLDYIQSLGANIIWLSPIHPSPSYHGYDVIDYYEVNPDFGTKDDLLALIQAVHERGMYIIMDYIANHTSNQNPLFTERLGKPDAPNSDFYKWTNDAHTTYQGFAGIGSMPQVNYASLYARDYMTDVATYWLDPNGDGDPSDGFDGLRCDVAVGPPLDFWAEVRTAMQQINPDSLLLAEAWVRSALDLQDYVQGNAFNAAFDFPTLHAIIADHDTNADGVVAGASPADLLETAMLASVTLYPKGAHLVKFLNNHDTNRIMSEVEGDFDRARAAAVLLMTAPGTPMIYYGEEIGMFGSKGHGNPYWDEYRREPMDWYESETGDGMTTWFAPTDRYNIPFDLISVEEENDDPASLINLYRSLTEIRNNTPSLRTDTFAKVDLSPEGDELYAAVLGEIASGNYTIVLINFSSNSVTASFTGPLPLPMLMSRVSVTLSEHFSLEGTEFTIEPAGFAILQMGG